MNTVVIQTWTGWLGTPSVSAFRAFAPVIRTRF